MVVTTTVITFMVMIWYGPSSVNTTPDPGVEQGDRGRCQSRSRGVPVWGSCGVPVGVSVGVLVKFLSRSRGGVPVQGRTGQGEPELRT